MDLATPDIGLYDAVALGAAALVLIVLMVTVILALRPRTPRLSAHRYNAELFKRRMALDELALDAINDVRVKDGQGQLVTVDNVVRLPASVLLVVSAPPEASGRVRAVVGLGEWRYLTPHNTIGTLLNPLIQLHPLISAIRARFPLVKVRVLTVFPDGADFAGAQPRLCCRTKDLIDQIRAFVREDGPPSPIIETAWPALAAILNRDGAPPGGRTAAPRGGMLSGRRRTA